MRFNEKRFANEYEERLKREGYPGIILEAILEEFDDIKDIIDVGAGTGFLAIPLIEKGYNVTAIEPSNEMIAIMKRKITDRLNNKITIVHNDWDSWEGGNTECIIAVHSLYPMKDKNKSILKMIKYSEKAVIILRSDIGSNNLTDIVRNNLKTKKESSKSTEMIKEFLLSEKINYSEKNINQSRKNEFNNIEKEAEYFCFHLGLDNKMIPEIIDILQEVTMFQNNEYSFISQYNDTMITIT